MRSFRKALELKAVSIVCAFVLAAMFCSAAYGAGELDPTFNASAYGKLNGDVNVIKIQPDGKILIGGFFTEVNGFAVSGVARLNADGSTDTSFKSLDFYGASGSGGEVFAIALQTDGKILVGGNFLGAGSSPVPGLRRLNADGSLDTSFNIFEISTDSTVYDIVILPDNKILVGGYKIGIFRLNADGTFDNTFTQSQSGNQFFGVKDIELQPDGKILIGGGGSSVGVLDRLTDTGADDNTFFSSSIGGGQIEEVKVRPDGKILIAGTFSNVNTYPWSKIALLDSTGLIDITFNSSDPNDAVNDTFLRPDGKILIAGRFTTCDDISRIRIAQLNANGLLDSSVQFNTTTSFGWINDVELQPDGKILVGGGIQFPGINPPTNNSLVRFNANGTSDSTFAPLVNRTGAVYKTLPQPDGKILAAGEFAYANGVKRNSLVRFNVDGSVDTSFVPFFNNLTPVPTIYSLAVQSDGKILVGLNLAGRVRRLNTDGTEDTGFAGPFAFTINDIVPLSNGQILVGGDYGPSAGFIKRINANGMDDPSFAPPQPNGSVYKILVQPDGKILIGGEFTQIGATPRGRIARLNATDGSLDNTFNSPLGANSTVFDLDLQADGKVILGGRFSQLNGSSNQVSIGRLNADGTLDTGFVQSTNSWVLAVKILPDGKILIGGSMGAVQGAAHNGIARLNSNGTVDAAFNTFASTTVQDINLQSDGKILLGGAFVKINGLSAVRIARLLNSSVPLRILFDYDGDGKADVSVYRSSNNYWYLSRSSDAQLTYYYFGVPGDIPTPADYDGDGKTDLAIFRPSSGDWWYQSSITGVFIGKHWGSNGDIPRPSDFDGDGKADYIVYHPANNYWYRLSSGTGQSSEIYFGTAGDKPLIGDFDGDGKSDPAIFRPSTGVFWYMSSIDSVHRAIPWGTSTDLPVPADYDGDGKTDAAVYRPSTGFWYIYLSGNGSYSFTNFGISEDKPVPADYDGDGKADIAVYRPSNGTWYMLRSTAGFNAQQFGNSTDVPTPNTLVP